jgi:hypothetical protein
MQARQAQAPYAIAAAVVIAVVGACTRVSTPAAPTSAAGQTTTAAADALATTQTAAPPPSPVAVNGEARDGTFAFTVGAVATDQHQLSMDLKEIYPQGVFVLIARWVKNIGTSQQRYFADYQWLLDSKGRLFSPNLADPPDDRVDINPGNRTPTWLYFDVPKGTTPSQYVLLLHASPDSAGVTVRLPDSYHKPSSPTSPPTTTGP